MTDDPATKSEEASDAAPEVKSVTGESGDLIFDTLWSRVLEAWNDDKTHAALLDYALRNERLPDAAGRYRALKDDPDKGAIAKKKLDAIVIAATQMMLAMKSPAARMKVPWQITLTAFAIMAFILVMIAYGVARRH